MIHYKWVYRRQVNVKGAGSEDRWGVDLVLNVVSDMEKGLINFNKVLM